MATGQDPPPHPRHAKTTTDMYPSKAPLHREFRIITQLLILCWRRGEEGETPGEALVRRQALVNNQTPPGHVSTELGVSKPHALLTCSGSTQLPIYPNPPSNGRACLHAQLCSDTRDLGFLSTHPALVHVCWVSQSWGWSCLWGSLHCRDLVHGSLRAHRPQLYTSHSYQLLKAGVVQRTLCLASWNPHLNAPLSPRRHQWPCLPVKTQRLGAVTRPTIWALTVKICI